MQLFLQSMLQLVQNLPVQKLHDGVRQQKALALQLSIILH